MPITPPGQLPPAPIAPRTIDPCANPLPSQLPPSIQLPTLRQVSQVNCQTPFQRVLSLFTTLTLGSVVATFSLIYEREWTITPRVISSLINAHAFFLQSFPRQNYH